MVFLLNFFLSNWKIWKSFKFNQIHRFLKLFPISSHFDWLLKYSAMSLINLRPLLQTIKSNKFLQINLLRENKKKNCTRGMFFIWWDACLMLKGWKILLTYELDLYIDYSAFIIPFIFHYRSHYSSNMWNVGVVIEKNMKIDCFLR